MSDDMKVVLTEIRKLNDRFDLTDQRLVSMDKQLDSLDKQLGSMDKRIESNHKQTSSQIKDIQVEISVVQNDLRIVKDQTARNYEFHVTMENTINEKISNLESDIKVLKMAIANH